MREFKFRCWHNQGNNIVDLLYEAAMLYDEKPGDCLVWKNQGQDIVDVMQFTGLRDNKGKEIYEGDIVRWVSVHNTEGREHIDRVDWVNDGYLLMPWIHELSQANCEVIGNIHETPELMEVRNGRI